MAAEEAEGKVKRGLIKERKNENEIISFAALINNHTRINNVCIDIGVQYYKGTIRLY